MKNTAAVFISAMYLGFMVSQANAAGTLMITEIMGSNSAVIDKNGHSPDWIEVYNGTGKKINLKGYRLSDKPDSPARWIFPEREIAPGEYLLVYASGKEKSLADGELHANFRLSKKDKGVYLSDRGGSLISGVEIDRLPRNISYGLHPATSAWEYFSSPTPGAANTTAAFSPVVRYSRRGGFYSSPFNVSLSAEGGRAAIYYTTDGSTPTLASKEYSDPIKIDRNTTIRAVSLEKGHLVSPVSGQAYFMNFDNKGMPVVSIATEEGKLWDAKSGLFRDVLYSDHMLRDKVDVHVSYFDERGNPGFSREAYMSVCGAGSREVMMRPLKLSANNDIDPLSGTFKCEFFGQGRAQECRHFQLRNNNQDGMRYVSDPECYPTMGIRNPLFCELVRGREDIEIRHDNGPVLLFINGKNYGMMNIGEKRDNTGIAENYPSVNSSDVDLLVMRDDMGMRVGRDKLAEGAASIRNDGKVLFRGYFMDGAVEYEEVSEAARRSGCTAAIDDFLSADPADETKFDPKSLIASMAAATIVCNTDFGMNNLAFWRVSPVGKDPGPFHAYIFDFDSTFGYAGGYEDYNVMLDYSEKTKIFNKFLKKDEYRIAFIRKIDEFLNGPFSPEYVMPVVDLLEKKMEPWIGYHLDMWAKGQMDKERWKKNVDRLRHFITVRPKYVRMHIKDHFGVKGYSDMVFSVTPQEAGSVYMDTGVFETQLAGRGTYAEIPMKISARAAAGYRFSHFNVNGSPVKEETCLLEPENGMLVEAVFIKDSTVPVADLVINEVVRSGECKLRDEDGKRQDWIEIYNTTKRSISLSGMYLSDDEKAPAKWPFPEISIGPGVFMVIFASGKNRTDPSGRLHTNFKLSGEPVLLVGKDGKTVIDKIPSREVEGIPKDGSGIRYPDGAGLFKYSARATPGAANK
ncbi:MAG: lamin tail domain-containing protein [Candidatus Omnitrophica bacterium]|nr:lamin tail domain-containing protein [Candidatus Omnitrophota bacterium]